MKYAITFLAAAAALTVALGAGGCRGCAEKADLDVIPGMKDSGIPDVKAAKEHEKEVQQLNKEMEELTKEIARVATDPSLSPAQKEQRMKELEVEVEKKSERLKEIAEDVTNRNL